MADSSTEATPSTTSPSPGINSPGDDHDPVAGAQASTRHLPPWIHLRFQFVGDGFRTGLAQRVGLRLAAALGHGLGEIGEKHREPQPERDLKLKSKSNMP